MRFASRAFSFPGVRLRSMELSGIKLLHGFDDLPFEVLVGLVNVVDMRGAHEVLADRLRDGLQRLLEVEAVELVIAESAANDGLGGFVLVAVGELGVGKKLGFGADTGQGPFPQILVSEDIG